MKKFIFLTIPTFLTFNVSAQIVMEDLIISTANKLNSDINILSSGYTQPLINAVLYGQNASLTTSTKTLNPFEFKFGALLTVVNVPSSEEIFNPPPLNFFEVTSAPTILGGSKEEKIQAVEYLRNLGVDVSFEFPSGIKADLPNEIFALPSFTASVGLPAAIEIQVNYFPEYSQEGLSYRAKGIGIKHVIDDYLKINSESKWHAAISLNYITSTMNYKKENKNISADFEAATIIGNAIVSYDTKLLSFFGGIGYFSSDYTFGMNNTLQISGEYANVLNPLIQDYSIDEVKNEPFAFIGSNLNILFLELVIKYNMLEYNSLLFGVNFDF